MFHKKMRKKLLVMGLAVSLLLATPLESYAAVGAGYADAVQEESFAADDVETTDVDAQEAETEADAAEQEAVAPEEAGAEEQEAQAEDQEEADAESDAADEQDAADADANAEEAEAEEAAEAEADAEAAEDAEIEEETETAVEADAAEQEPVEIAEPVIEEPNFGESITIMEPQYNASGVTADGFKYKEEGGHIAITGYTGSAKKIVIPDKIGNLPVTTIDKDAFKVDLENNKNLNCANIEEIVLENNVQYVRREAFANCTGLKKITIGKNMQILHTYAFAHCTALEELIIKAPRLVDATSEIWQDSVRDEDVVLNKDYNHAPFYNAGTLGKGITVTFTDEADHVPGLIFYGTKSNSSDTESVGVPKIVSVTLGTNVKKINDRAFDECKELSTVSWGSITDIGNYAFRKCSKIPALTTLPATLVTIGEYAFSSCSSLTEVNVPDNVTTIGTWAFYDCQNVKKLTIGNSVSKIGSFAFRECTALKDITIKSDVLEDGTKTVNAKTGYSMFYNAGLNEPAGIAVKFEGKCATVPANLFWAEKSASYAPKITSISFGASVKNVKANAFEDCKLITSVSWGSVTGIGDYAFSGCEGLAALENLPLSLVTIGDGAFNGCNKITTLLIPDNVTTIGKEAFKDCAKIKSVTIGNSVSKIGSFAFQNCYDLTEVVINSNVLENGTQSTNSKVGYSMFYNAGMSESGITVKFAGTCKTVPAYLFWAEKSASYAPKVTNVFFGDSVETVGDNAFVDCTGLIGVTWGKVKNIGASAFDGCTGLAALKDLPATLVTIGDGAFANCGGLTEVVIPDNVTTLGKNAFANCDKLSALTLGASLSAIGDGAFGECVVLTSVVVNSKLIADGEEKSNVFNNAGYKAAGITVSFGNTCTLVPGYLFHTDNASYAPKVVSVDLGAGVQQVNTGAFSGCVNLAKISWGGVQIIGKDAFANCSGLAALALPATVRTIGDGAFSGCTGFTSLETLPESVTTIGAEAFKNCSGVTKVVLPKNVVSIGKQAFEGCAAMESLVLDIALSAIGSEAFKDCMLLNSIVIESKDLVDGTNASNSADGFNIFYNAGRKGDGITVTMGEACNKVPAYLFCVNNSSYSCALKSITLGKNVKTVGTSAFENCTMLSSVKLANITTIKNNAFNHCAGLKSITIPATVKTIETGAFNDCQSLTSVTIKTRDAVFGSGVFQGHSRSLKLGVMHGSTAEDYALANNIKVEYLDLPAVEVEYVDNVAAGVKLKWNAVDGATGYIVYRKEGNKGAYKQLKKITKASTVSYTDKTAKANKTYTYKVLAYAKKMQSEEFEPQKIVRLTKTSISSLKAGKGTMTVKIKKYAKSSGYEIEYATDSKFTENAQVVSLSGASKVSKKITGLMSGTKYYVRVRCYKTVSGKRYYAPWSATKNVKVK